MHPSWILIKKSGLQLPLNAINRDVLHDAEAYPESIPNLIARVGRGGCFRALATEDRKPMIARTEFLVSTKSTAQEALGGLGFDNVRKSVENVPFLY